jgi:hypothetical protein
VEELVTELGPSDEAEVVRYSELFAPLPRQMGQGSMLMTADEVG